MNSTNTPKQSELPQDSPSADTEKQVPMVDPEETSEPTHYKSFTEQLREDLENDEGVKYEIYLDHLGLPTFGIGHLVRELDEEYGLEVGTAVNDFDGAGTVDFDPIEFNPMAKLI